jgi:hypothetical protein
MGSAEQSPRRLGDDDLAIANFRCDHVTSSPAGTCPDRANVEPATLSQTFVSVEKPLNELVAADLKMGSYVAKNSSQCSHFERVVIGNRDMMLPALAGSQPQVAARLPCDFVPKRPSRLARSAPETSLGNFILPKGAVSTGAQQASTSSRTKCKRITFGAFPSSK